MVSYAPKLLLFDQKYSKNINIVKILVFIQFLKYL